MATIQCRSCDSAADAGVSGSSRAAATMAKALNPCFGGRWKKRGKPPLRRPCPHLLSSDFSRRCTASEWSPHDIGVMRKIVACWSCGRTFWAWRTRELNFCSGKCRVRHHRSGAYRRPKPPESSDPTSQRSFPGPLQFPGRAAKGQT